MNGIFQSPRFWLIVAIAVLQALAVFNVLGGEQVDQLINIISIALGGIIANKTIDKIGEKTIIAAGVQKGSVDIEDVVKVPPQE